MDFFAPAGVTIRDKVAIFSQFDDKTLFENESNLHTKIAFTHNVMPYTEILMTESFINKCMGTNKLIVDAASERSPILIKILHCTYMLKSSIVYYGT